nr:hypothetical protein [Victivallis sp. Marseille-Q1083]
MVFRHQRLQPDYFFRRLFRAAGPLKPVEQFTEKLQMVEMPGCRHGLNRQRIIWLKIDITNSQPIIPILNAVHLLLVIQPENIASAQRKFFIADAQSAGTGKNAPEGLAGMPAGRHMPCPVWHTMTAVKNF